MLVSLKKNITFLAMPKTASTSIETALAPHCPIIFGKNPVIKHISYRRYDRFIVPYLDEIGHPSIDTTCLIREPISWLFSWYKYRSRPNIVDPTKSTADMTFDEFAIGYIGDFEDFPSFGRQSQFLADRSGIPSVKYVFRYENMQSYIQFLEGRFSEKFSIGTENVSPIREFELSSYMRSKLEQFLSSEYEIYETALTK